MYSILKECTHCGESLKRRHGLMLDRRGWCINVNGVTFPQPRFFISRELVSKHNSYKRLEDRRWAHTVN